MRSYLSVIFVFAFVVLGNCVRAENEVDKPAFEEFLESILESKRGMRKLSDKVSQRIAIEIDRVETSIDEKGKKRVDARHLLSTLEGLPASSTSGGPNGFREISFQARILESGKMRAVIVIDEWFGATDKHNAKHKQSWTFVRVVRSGEVFDLDISREKPKGDKCTLQFRLRAVKPLTNKDTKPQ